MDELLRRQWTVLRLWIEGDEVADRLEDPSGLGSWTVAEVGPGDGGWRAGTGLVAVATRPR